MVSVSGPISTGILAGRPSGSQGPRQNGDAVTEGEKDSKAAERARVRHESDLYVRPSWTDAAIALDQLEKVREKLTLFDPSPFLQIHRDLGLIYLLPFSSLEELERWNLFRNQFNIIPVRPSIFDRRRSFIRLLSTFRSWNKKFFHQYTK